MKYIKNKKQIPWLINIFWFQQRGFVAGRALLELTALLQLQAAHHKVRETSAAKTILSEWCHTGLLEVW
jgi:hypothetical protein